MNQKITITPGKRHEAMCPCCGAAERFRNISVMSCKPILAGLLWGGISAGLFFGIKGLMDTVAVTPLEGKGLYAAGFALILLGVLSLSAIAVWALLRNIYPAGALQCVYCDHRFLVKNKTTKGLYIIVGASGIGKSTVLERLKWFGYSSFASVTTRSRRKLHEEGHKFVSARELKELMQKQPVYAFKRFDDAFYCILRQQIDGADVCTLEPDGCVQLQSASELDRPVVVVYLHGDKHLRAARMKKRGDSAEKIAKRLAADEAAFTEEFRAGAAFEVSAAKRPLAIALAIHRFIRKHEKKLEAAVE